MIQKFQDVVFTADLPAFHVAAGDVGTVVDVIRDVAAYQIEVFFLDGSTMGVVTAEASQIRPITSLDVTHARPLNSAEELTRG